MIKAGAHTVFFTSEEIVFAASEQAQGEDAHSSAVRLRFDGANTNVEVQGTQPLVGVSNFFLGNDPDNWQSNVPTYATITYHDLYPGIDLVYSGKQGRLKSEFVVVPGAEPTTITMNYSGASSMYLRDDGALVLQTPIGELIEEAPYIYQMINEEQVVVEGGYRLLEDERVGFTLGDYNPTKPLIIDPVLIYSTYLGGSSDDRGNGIAVDASGCAYVTGDTYSGDFPVKNSYGSVPTGTPSVFVTKLDPSGSSLVYSTYLGGGLWEYGYSIAVDTGGCAYVTGATCWQRFGFEPFDVL